MATGHVRIVKEVSEGDTGLFTLWLDPDGLSALIRGEAVSVDSVFPNVTLGKTRFTIKAK